MLEAVDFDDVCDGTDACTSVGQTLYPFCDRLGSDLMIRSSSVTHSTGSVPWTAEKRGRETRDSGPYMLDYGLPGVLTHEFGHVLGFNHSTAAISSVMGGNQASNVGGQTSINEEDYDALIDAKPGSSTGLNVALSKITAAGVDGDSRFNAERFDTFTDSQEVAPPAARLNIGAAAVPPDSVFQAIDVLNLGTSSLTNVVIRWRLRPLGQGCSGSGTFLLDERVIGTLARNTPYAVLPDNDLVVPAGVTAGLWAWCAIVDPLDVIDETDETDNVVLSDPATVLTVDP